MTSEPVSFQFARPFPHAAWSTQEQVIAPLETTSESYVRRKHIGWRDRLTKSISFHLEKKALPKDTSSRFLMLSHWTEFCYKSTPSWKLQMRKGLCIEIQLAKQWYLPHICINIYIINSGKSYVSLISLEGLWEQISNQSNFILHTELLLASS